MIHNQNITVYEALRIDEALERIYKSNISTLPFQTALAIQKIRQELGLLGETCADMLDESHDDNFLNELIEIPTYGLSLGTLLSVNNMKVNTLDIELLTKLLPTS